MRKRVPSLSGKEMLRVLEQIGFVQIRQRGSHVTVRREQRGIVIVLTVPLHATLRKGTLHSILKIAEMTIKQLGELL